jgi:RHS repeat-associated protein
LFADTFVVRYAYDGLGRRISRDGSGGFEEYLYDGPHVIAILDDQQDVVSTLSYYPGVDRPHSLMTDTETYYYATDPTGSVIGLAEFTGAASVTHRYRYDVWGGPHGGVTEAVPNPVRFKARWWDEYTGLYDFRGRWYDPEIGRFISEDPIGLAGGINVYTFAGNDPVSGWDPFGLFDPDGPCSQTFGAPTCTLDPITADGSPGNFNPSGAIDYFGSGGGPIPLGYGQSGGKAAGAGGSSGAGSVAADTVEVACRPIFGSNSGAPGRGIGHCGIRIHNAEVDLLVELQPNLSQDAYWTNYFTGSGPGGASFGAFGAGNFYMVPVPPGMTSLEFDGLVLSSIGNQVAGMAGRRYLAGDSNRFVGAVLRRSGATVPSGVAGGLWTPGLH